MEIKTSLEGRGIDIVYKDFENQEEVKNLKVAGVHGFCFYQDKLVVVYSEKKDSWTPPGGGVDGDETAEEAVIREIKEESNMKVMHHEFIGYQIITEPNKVSVQTRSFCIVEPYGDFTGDTAEDAEITEIKLINPEDYKQYFDWGVIGEHILQKAMKMKAAM